MVETPDVITSLVREGVPALLVTLTPLSASDPVLVKLRLSTAVAAETDESALVGVAVRLPRLSAD